jgi:hypothetical protein
MTIIHELREYNSKTTTVAIQFTNFKKSDILQ